MAKLATMEKATTALICLELVIGGVATLMFLTDSLRNSDHNYKN